jgi:hypothetical protein
LEIEGMTVKENAILEYNKIKATIDLAFVTNTVYTTAHFNDAVAILA